MKYRHKQTGEVVELPLRVPKNLNEALMGWFIYGQFVDTANGQYKDFHANYEPLEEGGQDAHTQ